MIYAAAIWTALRRQLIRESRNQAPWEHMETLAWRRPECRHVDWPVDEAAVATKLITQRVLDVPSRTSSLSYVGTCAADQSAGTGGYLGGTHSLRALGAYVQACWAKTISCLYRHLLRHLKLHQQHMAFVSGFRWGHQKTVDKQVSHDEFPCVIYIFDFENQHVFPLDILCPLTQLQLPLK